jgi:glutamyl-tRNA synthetase
MPILFASIMGKLQGPPLFDSVAILGKDRARARFLKTIEFLGGISNKKMDALKKGWDHKDCKGLIETVPGAAATHH